MRFLNLIFNFSLLTLGATAKAQKQADTTGSALKFRIVVLGSSTAEGVGAHPADSAWVNRYRAWLQSINPANEVINLGLGGYCTYQLMPNGYRPSKPRPLPDPQRNITKALSLRPDAVIVNAPSNDVASGHGVEEQVANLEAIARQGAEKGVPVWICTTQPRHFSADKVLLQLFARHAILEKFGARAIDLWKTLASPDGLIELSFNSGDGTHLSNAGHEAVFEKVKTSGILEALCREPRRSWLWRWFGWFR